ncbi:uncharacterized protein LOC126291833 isoform X3 [Schistocerca gregaria]|uniref:uncharacterized protein LOC126291833 isoform X3 n=1 Tax=Schistocerca gregaria TaxID=7010 RepID=UPI00211E843E|nr:uncharacterized protein LOC126291833 isoform X3 [Schistocerca gregaria]
MSQLGEGTSPERTYSMDWSQEHPSQQETRCIYDCGTYNYNREQWREPFVSQMEKSTNTDGFCDALTADCGGSEESESEIETEEHKVCAMIDVVSQVEIKEKDEDQDNTQDFHVKNENKVALQGNCMPPGKCLYHECIQPCYIKDEVASPASFVSPGCEAKYDFENNHLPQPTTCPCAIKRICPYEVCNELGICSTWAETRMQIDADIQADCNLSIAWDTK